MKQKKWKDCPACGAKGSMEYRANLSETYKIKDYGVLRVAPLNAYCCLECHDKIFTLKSSRLIDSRVTEHKARIDSQRIVASELMDIATVAKKIGKSRQRVHQLMKEGGLRYVYVGTLRLPTKNSLEAYLKNHP